MSEFKGTPGPWERDKFGNVVHGQKDGYGHKENVRLSGVTLSGRVTPEYEANTKLVAAAPEMLRTLKSVKDEIGHFLMHQNPELLSEIDFAIAKALGESK